MLYASFLPSQTIFVCCARYARAPRFVCPLCAGSNRGNQQTANGMLSSGVWKKKQPVACNVSRVLQVVQRQNSRAFMFATARRCRSVPAHMSSPPDRSRKSRKARGHARTPGVYVGVMRSRCRRVVPNVGRITRGDESAPSSFAYAVT